jgi:hypothetical protein
MPQNRPKRNVQFPSKRQGQSVAVTPDTRAGADNPKDLRVRRTFGAAPCLS